MLCTKIQAIFESSDKNETKYQMRHFRGFSNTVALLFLANPFSKAYKRFIFVRMKSAYQFLLAAADLCPKSWRMLWYAWL